MIMSMGPKNLECLQSARFCKITFVELFLKYVSIFVYMDGPKFCTCLLSNLESK